MNPKISIIIPVYNAEKYLRKCIESILSQSFNDFELILVNDGSSDNSLDICKEYSKNDGRVRIICKENGGAASARNEGLNIAKGDYIAFIDADDFINKDMYKILYNMAIKNDADLVICEYLNIEEDEEKKYDEINNMNYYEKQYDNTECLNLIYSDRNISMIVPWNKLYKKNIFENIRYPEGRICEDEFIAHRILHKCEKILYTNRCLYYYVQSSNSVMRKPFNRKRLDSVYAFQDRMYFYKKLGEKNLIYKSQITYYNNLFILYFKMEKEGWKCKEEYKMVRKDFLKFLILYAKNPFCEYKDKISILLFMISPFIYKLYEKIRTIIKIVN